MKTMVFTLGDTHEMKAVVFTLGATIQVGVALRAGWTHTLLLFACGVLATGKARSCLCCNKVCNTAPSFSGFIVNV